MRIATANHTTEAGQRPKKPVIIVEPRGITRKWCSDDFGNIGANHRKYIKQVNLTLSKIDLLDAPLIQTGRGQIEIIDKGLDVSNELQADFHGRDLVIKAGF